MTENRIYRSSDLDLLKKRLSGKTINLAYGHFSVIHPGHIRYLKNSSKNADFLIVALQNDILDNGTNRFRFPQPDRSFGILATNLCDFVVVLEHDNDLSSVIDFLSPSRIFLGTNYDSVNIQQSVRRALEVANDKGISIIYDSGALEYASSDLFRLDVRQQMAEKRNAYIKCCETIGVSKTCLLDIVKHISSTRLTVIGDTIVDEYAACEALGMSGEAPVIVVKELELQTFVGGAAIVAAHAVALGASINFISVLGDDANRTVVVDQLARWQINDLTVVDESRPTTYKKRYMVENQKLFRVSKLEDASISHSLEQLVIDKIDSCMADSQGFIFSDFAYGIITDGIINHIKEKKALYPPVFADVQCSSQFGTITKYTNVYLICPNEREARMALQDNTSGIEVLSHNLMQACKCKYMIMKLDTKGFVAYHQTSPGTFINQYFPALSANPVDVTGAGDSLLSIMSLCLSAGVDFFKASALACIMCSIAVEQIGNKPISSEKLIDKINMIFGNH